MLAFSQQTCYTSNQVITDLFIIMRRKAPRKLKWLAKKSLCSLLKRNHNFNYKRDFGARTLMPPYRSCQRNSKHKPGLMSLHKKMKFSIKDFLSKCDQIRSFLQIWSHLRKKSLMENFIFCAVCGSKEGQMISKKCNLLC